ncbi:hypothetical protein [Vibrio furnissii]|uniref:hypothetical protein n=1 Tax=Vibrio furnissii TaxID=29494 RepID=UPI001EEC8F95|nr:hypothetical protein [Vibrio furnissii]
MTNSVAYITLHNLPTYTKSAFSTATFFRRADGEPSAVIADMFYRMFDNEQNARTYIESMICASPAYIELDSVSEMSPSVCRGEYHYHLDMASFELKVLKYEFWNPEANVETAIDCQISEFINEYKSGVVSLVVGDDKHGIDIFTARSTISKMREAEEIINSLVKKTPKDPVIISNIKLLEKLYRVVSTMSINDEDRAYVSNLMSKLDSLNARCTI